MILKHFTKTLLGKIIAIILFLLPSCATRKQVASVPQEKAKVSNAEIKKGSLPPFRATREKLWELEHTKIDIRFNFKNRTADAKTTLTMHPYFYAMDSVVLDAVAMTIKSVKDNTGKDLEYAYDKQFLKIQLPKKFQQSDKLTIVVDYTTNTYEAEQGGTAAIRGDRGLFFINTKKEDFYKPAQIWTQGEMQSNSRWFPTFDSPNFKSTFEITMHVPEEYATLSNGILVNSKKEASGIRADTWQQQQAIAPYLAMMTVGDFAIKKETWNGKEVAYYVPKNYAETAKEIFNHTPEMLTFFSNITGVPYPWDKYSQVGVYNFISGAMENNTASVFGSFNLKNKRELADDHNDQIVAHELFHHWFGNYVTCESWSNLSLNESFADYSEYLWAEYKYGKNAAEEVWTRGMQRYLVQAEKYDPPLIRYHYHQKGEMFDRVTYNKGGRTLNYLRGLMGDAAFFKSMKVYLEKNKFGTAEAADLRMAFEKVTGQDWNWFFDEWYFKAGHPKLDINYEYNDAKKELKVKVKQVQKDSIGLYYLPLKAQLITASGNTTFDWIVDKKKEQTFTYAYPNNQRPVFIPDALNWLPGEIADKKFNEDALWQFKKSGSYITKRNAVATFVKDKNNFFEEGILNALNDTIASIRVFALEQLVLSSKKLTSALKEKTYALAQHDANFKVQAAAINVLGNIEGAAYNSIFEEKINSSSYNVAGSALRALDKSNHTKAYEIAQKIKDNDLRSALQRAVADVMAKEGNPQDYNYLTSTILKEFDARRAALINSFNTYLLNVNDINLFQNGLQFLNVISEQNEGQDKVLITGLLENMYSEFEKLADINKNGKNGKLYQEKKDIASTFKKKETK